MTATVNVAATAVFVVRAVATHVVVALTILIVIVTGGGSGGGGGGGEGWLWWCLEDECLAALRGSPERTSPC